MTFARATAAGPSPSRTAGSAELPAAGLSVAGALVFHVERLPLRGWDAHHPSSLGGGVQGEPDASRTGTRPLRPAPKAAVAETTAPGRRGVPGGPVRRLHFGVGSRPSGWRRVWGWPLLALLWIYRRLVSPALPPACRYYPSCSQYAMEAVALHGPIRGAWLALRRLLRCHPWAPGGPDPVPPPRGRPDPERAPR
jgi:putative membrane protein insertion efficiency factor